MTREIRSSRASARSDIRDLLESVFVALLLAPPTDLWIISPWISNVEIIDNSAARFRGLNSDWDASTIRLSNVLVELAGRGTETTVVTRTGEADAFIASLAEAATDAPTDNLFHLVEDDLHEKGIHTTEFSITGSMNLTWNGINKNDELVRVDYHEDGNHEAIATFRDRYMHRRCAL